MVARMHYNIISKQHWKSDEDIWREHPDTHTTSTRLCGVSARKAAGPDGIPGRVLKDCADQLATVLTNIFNLSQSQAIVPTCLKTATIVPVPKTIKQPQL